jgi:hypothetical protein
MYSRSSSRPTSNPLRVPPLTAPQPTLRAAELQALGAVFVQVAGHLDADGLIQRARHPAGPAVRVRVAGPGCGSRRAAEAAFRGARAGMRGAGRDARRGPGCAAPEPPHRSPRSRPSHCPGGFGLAGALWASQYTHRSRKPISTRTMVRQGQAGLWGPGQRPRGQYTHRQTPDGHVTVRHSDGKRRHGAALTLPGRWDGCAVRAWRAPSAGPAPARDGVLLLVGWRVWVAGAGAAVF